MSHERTEYEMGRIAFILTGILAGFMIALTVPSLADDPRPRPPSDTSECLAGSVTLRGDRTNRLGQTRTVWVTKGVCPNGYQLVVRYKTPWGQPYVEPTGTPNPDPTPVPPGTPGQK